MKSLETKKLVNAKSSTDAFSKTIDSVKASAEKIERKSYTITLDNINHINDYAVSLAKQSGTIVTASAALRIIINSHKETTK